MTTARQLLLGTAADSSGAIFSEDGIYRYRLWRRWGNGPYVLWVMLNPSTAGETMDDPTVRRCRGFTRAFTVTGDDGVSLLGPEAFEIVNLFALRATNPRRLNDARDPVGPHNDAHILSAAKGAARIICAWGGAAGVDRRLLLEREAAVRELLAGAGKHCYCLGRTREGLPRHPLMLPRNAQLEAMGPWE